MSTLKGLLLSRFVFKFNMLKFYYLHAPLYSYLYASDSFLFPRHQFPTLLAGSGDGGIPAWQRASKASPTTLEQMGGAGPPTSRPTDDLEGLDSELKPT